MELLDEFLAATEGMTQERAAEVSGIHQRTISRWRNPKTRPKSLDDARVAALEEALRRLRGAQGASEERSSGSGAEERWGSSWEEVLVRESRASENRAMALRLDAEAAVKEAEAAALRARAMEARAYATRTTPSTGGVEPAGAPGLGTDLLQLLVAALRQADSLQSTG